MRVGVQREACRKMPQHARYGFDVHTVLQGQRCESVPLRYNYDKPEKPRYQGFSVIWQGFSSFSKPKNRAAK